jgi:chemotaxis response regulator CheB
MIGGRAQAIVIGASAGALEALSAILPALPAGFDLPLFVVVHIPSDKRSVLAELFQAKCQINVREAEDRNRSGAARLISLRRTIIYSSKAIERCPCRAMNPCFSHAPRSTFSLKVLQMPTDPA